MSSGWTTSLLGSWEQTMTAKPKLIFRSFLVCLHLEKKTFNRAESKQAQNCIVSAFEVKYCEVVFSLVYYLAVISETFISRLTPR